MGCRIVVMGKEDGYELKKVGDSSVDWQWLAQVLDGLDAEVVVAAVCQAVRDAPARQPDGSRTPAQHLSPPARHRHLASCNASAPFLAFLALSWSHVAAISCATGGSMNQEPSESTMAHHDGASHPAGEESSHSNRHEDPERGECTMMLACAVTSGEPLGPAVIRSFPGVAFQAGPFIQRRPPPSSADPWTRLTLPTLSARRRLPASAVALGLPGSQRTTSHGITLVAVGRA